MSWKSNFQIFRCVFLGAFLLINIQLPKGVQAEPSTKPSTPCSLERIQQLVAELFAQHMKDYFSRGPSANSLLLKRKLLVPNLEQLLVDYQMLFECDPGNLYCLDHDILFGGQDYWEDAQHVVLVKQLAGRFEATVRAHSPKSGALGERQILISCNPRPQIEDISDGKDGSELAGLSHCAKLNHSPSELSKYRARKGK